MTDLTSLSIREAGTLLARRSISPAELATATLRRVEETEPFIHAYARVFPEQAQRAARQADRELPRGRAPAWHPRAEHHQGCASSPSRRPAFEPEAATTRHGESPGPWWGPGLPTGCSGASRRLVALRSCPPGRDWCRNGRLNGDSHRLPTSHLHGPHRIEGSCHY
jgi:hypothetical protein